MSNLFACQSLIGQLYVSPPTTSYNWLPKLNIEKLKIARIFQFVKFDMIKTKIRIIYPTKKIISLIFMSFNQIELEEQQGRASQKQEYIDSEIGPQLSSLD